MRTTGCASAWRPARARRRRKGAIGPARARAARPPHATAAMAPRRRRRFGMVRTAGLLATQEAAIGGRGMPPPAPESRGFPHGLTARFAPPSPSRRAIVLQLLDGDPEAEQQHPGAGRPRYRRRSGYCPAEFVDLNSEPDRQPDLPKASQSRRPTTRPSSNSPLGRARNARQPPIATIPSYCVHRQPPIMGAVPAQIASVAGHRHRVRAVIRSHSGIVQPAYEGPTSYRLLTIAALHQEITPQFPITWKGNCAIWMPGKRLKAPKS